MSIEVAAHRRRRVEGLASRGECLAGVVVTEVIVRVVKFCLHEVRKFITRHTAYNKHDTGWAKGAPSEDHTIFSKSFEDL